MVTTITIADIVLISGSVSPASRSIAALEYVQYALRREEQVTHTLFARDLLAVALPSTSPTTHPAMQKALTAIENAPGIIVLTPIYNAAYSGLLKAFLDFLPQESLAGKTVLPIATGGSPAELLSVDRALKPVLFALGARYVLPGVCLSDAQISHTGEGRTSYSNQFRIEESGEARLLEGITTLLYGMYGMTSDNRRDREEYLSGKMFPGVEYP